MNGVNVMNRPTQSGPALRGGGVAPGADAGDHGSGPALGGSISGIVGEAILGGTDVSQVRRRRRITRLRRLVAACALLAGWAVIRQATGHSFLPSVTLPHWFSAELPAFLIVLVLAVVMLAPLLGAGRSPHTLIRPGETAVGLEDLVGIDPIKSEVVRTINLFLAHRTFREAMGGSSRRGVLFEGPPGTGKTFVAKAMAKEANVPFLFVSASAFQSMYYGQTNRKIRSFFKALRSQARKEGGAIGFIEEIDAIGAARRGLGGGGPNEGITGVVNELLVQLQSFDTPTRGRRLAWAWIDLVNRYLPDGSKLRKPTVTPANVLVVGATNRKDDLDPALIRPGRFDRTIYFGLPGRQSRGEIVEYYLKKKSHGADLDAHGAADIVAGMTFGYSPAALERLMDEALVIALDPRSFGHVHVRRGGSQDARRARPDRRDHLHTRRAFPRGHARGGTRHGGLLRGADPPARCPLHRQAA